MRYSQVDWLGYAPELKENKKIGINVGNWGLATLWLDIKRKSVIGIYSRKQIVWNGMGGNRMIMVGMVPTQIYSMFQLKLTTAGLLGIFQNSGHY